MDSTVLAIVNTYDNEGLKEKITSWSDAAATGTVRNEVSYTFNGFGMPVREYQEHEGAVDANTPYVLYGYDTSNDGNGAYTKGLRLSTFGYPAVGENRYTRSDSTVTARTLYYLYAGLDDQISRVTTLSDGSTRGDYDANVLADYKYLGRGTIVEEDYVNEGLSLSYKGTTAGTYPGLDRFGRVVNQEWTNEYDSDYNDQWQYAYDVAGNPTWRHNALSAGKSSQYTYDGLHRLKAADQGTVSGTWPSVTMGTKNYGQAWTLDQVGNWPEFKIDATGDGNYSSGDDLDQNRTHNGANEITGITEDFGTIWKDPAQDAAGNMTVMPQPLSPTGQFYCVYDAWNRLTQVVVDANANGEPDTGETVTGEYEYDGLNRRVRKHRDTLTTDYNFHFYYNTSWQIMEIRQTIDGQNHVPEIRPPFYQYVWSQRYIDALVLRDDNTECLATDLCDDGRTYLTTDANMNVTSTSVGGGTGGRFDYRAYGGLVKYSAGWTLLSGTTVTDCLPRYCGYWYDVETGLYCVRNRYYTPLLGRWAQRDRSGYVDGLNLLEYVNGRPTSHVDYTGNEGVQLPDELAFDVDLKNPPPVVVGILPNNTVARFQLVHNVKELKALKSGAGTPANVDVDYLSRTHVPAGSTLDDVLAGGKYIQTEILTNHRGWTPGGEAFVEHNSKLSSVEEYVLPLLQYATPSARLRALRGDFLLFATPFPPPFGLTVNLRFTVDASASLCCNRNNVVGYLGEGGDVGIQLHVEAALKLEAKFGDIVSGVTNRFIRQSEKGGAGGVSDQYLQGHVAKMQRDGKNKDGDIQYRKDGLPRGSSNGVSPGEYRGWKEWKGFKDRLRLGVRGEGQGAGGDNAGTGWGLPPCKIGFGGSVTGGVEGELRTGVWQGEFKWELFKWEFGKEADVHFKPTYDSSWGLKGVGFTVGGYVEGKGTFDYPILFGN